MSSLWVVVADTCRSRIFTADESSSLEEIKDMTHLEGRLHDREMTQDLPGKIKTVSGAGGHAYEQPTDPKKHEASVFARDVSSYLTDAYHGNRFSRLMIIAEPSMLGLLRKELPDSVRQAVVFELDKHLTTADKDEIKAHLPRHG